MRLLNCPQPAKLADRVIKTQKCPKEGHLTCQTGTADKIAEIEKFC
jgi:hypothetical protein